MSQNLFDLTGKVAVVIGGTTGLGREIALGMARSGADVIPSSRRAAQLEAVAAEIESIGRRTLRIPCDVLDRASIDHLHAEVLKAFGKVDILVNAAGITQKIPTLEVSDADWARIMETNLTGTVRSCQIFGATMAKAGHGRIINTASIAGFDGFFQVAAYAASKCAVASFTKTLAVELAGSGVNVNALAPGVFPTPLNMSLIMGTSRGEEILMRTPMHRFGDPSEVVGTVIFLASAASNFITGQIIFVDGGFSASGVNQ